MVNGAIGRTNLPRKAENQEEEEYAALEKSMRNNDETYSRLLCFQDSVLCYACSMWVTHTLIIDIRYMHASMVEKSSFLGVLYRIKFRPTLQTKWLHADNMYYTLHLRRPTLRLSLT